MNVPLQRPYSAAGSAVFWILWSAFFRRVSRRFIGHGLILPASILWVSATAALLLPAALLWTRIWISLLIAIRGSSLRNASLF